MAKWRGTIFLCTLLLTACTAETVQPKDQIQEEQNDENIVVTKDGKITFEIKNEIGVPPEKVEAIKDEIVTAYDHIKASIHTSYTPSEHINVWFKEDGLSWGLASKIELVGVQEDSYPLVHEMTHSLLGYGNNFGSDHGYFTQEGFASYMEEQYGKKEQFSFEKFMKHYLDSDKLIPISKLIDPNQDDVYFRPALSSEEQNRVMMEMSYTHAASFVKFLIDTYGLEKFEHIYNEKELAQKLEEVYGKSSSELEKEWLAFIQQQQGFTHEEKLKSGFFYDMNTTLLQIDPKYFANE
ncbi:hypothetical protein QH639_12115 [Lysinibacillus sp. 1 U-2021]|uniref:hypothetical protein n=1 Tax=Lysinibacillus sp. 1 U-2021 TaxID=3039426 RepID=UPI0024805CF8|nr:hypothetical protein [Lysinibacillus sp. 1 U-2021]WGT41487.1 hypothetical protein QH639_12115 [Lysinibacillus sp. 1 U-2021]